MSKSPLLYEIRTALGWNDKTSLSILPRGVRELRMSHGELLAALVRVSAGMETKGHEWDCACSACEARNAIRRAKALS